MYITIAVLISRSFDEVEAEEAGVPEGKERDTREIESELEALLAPHDADTTLNIPTRGPDLQKSRTIPNYNARFDFWEVEGLFFERHSDRLAGVEVEHMIYSQKVNSGQEVIAAADVPPDLP